MVSVLGEQIKHKIIKYKNVCGDDVILSPHNKKVLDIHQQFCYIIVCSRGYSSAGRALEWHSRGQRFDPAYLHQDDWRSW